MRSVSRNNIKAQDMLFHHMVNIMPPQMYIRDYELSIFEIKNSHFILTALFLISFASRFLMPQYKRQAFIRFIYRGLIDIGSITPTSPM